MSSEVVGISTLATIDSAVFWMDGCSCILGKFYKRFMHVH